MPPPKTIASCDLGISAIMCLSKIGLYQDGQLDVGTGYDWYIKSKTSIQRKK